ncbi:hypothetical protein TNCV_1882381 [Trichonephila clavipes]|nr:hypothetical protein TNCV_1882381 [Trichonephila clavipes]
MKKRKCGTAPEVRRPGAPEGRGLIWLLHLQALAEQNGVAFTPWLALPGVDTPDVHRPLRPVVVCTGDVWLVESHISYQWFVGLGTLNPEESEDCKLLFARLKEQLVSTSTTIVVI